jgi:hypothetical protein
MSNDYSDTIIHFGKYSGKTIEEIPSGYLKWLIDNCTIDEICEAAEQEYEYRSAWNKHWNGYESQSQSCI